MNRIEETAVTDVIAAPADIVSDIVNARIGASTARPYQPVIGAVITALEMRDEAIADALRMMGERENLDPMKVEAALVEIGIAKPEVEEPEQDGTPEATPAWATDIMGRLDRLESIARRAGYMGTPVRD
jgi:hypothetical protein